MSLPHTLRRLPVVAWALAIAACAPCPIPRTQPAPPSPPPAAVQPPAPLEPSRVEPGDTQVVVEPAPGRVLEVQIRTTQEGASGKFSPAELRVRRGDVVRFRMADGYSIHNVSFAHLQHDRPGIPLPADSPMLYQEGQSWQFRVDLPPGTYEFVCIPHALVGMRGTLIVEP
ncbi:MAG TPA: plastocyanin/azurin family copper-binding protein [Longimicrobium sp.]|nr:plastocyanin/azurin family copper-binding protein [Longimicrobium sp.]